jgi:hypothetical protein
MPIPRTHLARRIVALIALLITLATGAGAAGRSKASVPAFDHLDPWTHSTWST